MSYQPIENYGIIGDLHTAALVGMDGSIDFMCLPHFDSPTIFAALLDHEKGGRFRLAPKMEQVRRKQMYLPDSPVLLTRFLGSDGVGEVSDFMPIKDLGHCHDLVRRAKAVLGEVRFQMLLAPRFDYGRAGHRIERKDGEVLFISEGADRTVLRLRTALPVRVENGSATADFVLRAGETASFVLEQVADGAGGLLFVAGVPALRSRGSNLAKPGPVCSIDGPRLDAALFAASSVGGESRQSKV